ncbi:MAG TPA: hypothetical protein VFZ48_00060 [Candidatus Saccharimonadales bacterium]
MHLLLQKYNDKFKYLDTGKLNSSHPDTFCARVGASSQLQRANRANSAVGFDDETRQPEARPPRALRGRGGDADVIALGGSRGQLLDEPPYRIFSLGTIEALGLHDRSLKAVDEMLSGTRIHVLLLLLIWRGIFCLTYTAL